MRKIKNNHLKGDTMGYKTEKKIPSIILSVFIVLLMQIGQKVENTIIHFAHYDEKFQNVIKSIDADYIIWYAPYKIFCGYTENGKLANQPLPQAVIIDVKALKQGNITCDHYVESLMVSAEG